MTLNLILINFLMIKIDNKRLDSNFIVHRVCVSVNVSLNPGSGSTPSNDEFRQCKSDVWQLIIISGPTTTTLVNKVGGMQQFFSSKIAM